MKLKIMGVILPVALFMISMDVRAGGSVMGEMIHITQDVEASKLSLKNNQTLDKSAIKTGYTLEEVSAAECTHTTDKITGTIKCTPAPTPLKPTKKQLKNNIVLTGKLKGKSYETEIKSYDAGGVNNTVSHYRLLADVDAPNIGTFILAEPYVCPDTYAAYSYYERHFSYCPNVKKFYHIGDSHTWLGCTKGEVGENEFHFKPYTHIFSIYQFFPNQYTVSYNANGGEGTMGNQQAVYDTAFQLDYNRFVRRGYRFAGWSTDAGGAAAYRDSQSVKNLTAKKDGIVTLYAQWVPNIYAVTLDKQIYNPDSPGTEAIFEKYDTGWYLDPWCTNVLRDRNNIGSIAPPTKKGYVFQGYFESRVGGRQMIDAAGVMTGAGIAEYRQCADTSWYARYHYQVACEDYADIPCDFRKAEGENREDIGVLIAYNKETGQTVVTTGSALPSSGQLSGTEQISSTGQTCFTVTLTGKPAGTKVGKFQSGCAGKFTNQKKDLDSIAQSSGGTDTVFMPAAPQEGAAYQLRVDAAGKTLCDRIVYFESGRFRTAVKLGVNKEKEVPLGGNIAGSAWNAERAEYPYYQYSGCTEVKNIQAPDVVYRYFVYKNVNMAYSGNGATFGDNILEQDVFLENAYCFRENPFTREEEKTKQTKGGQEYKCDVIYNFTGWQMISGVIYQEKDKSYVLDIYNMAKNKGVILDHTVEDMRTYRKVEPIDVKDEFYNLPAVIEEKQSSKAGQKDGINGLTSEYINLLAMWNASPTIVVTPEDSLEFYEGEDVTKEDLISHLTSHDEEDNENMSEKPDLNDNIRIIKIAYPESKNGSQTSYEKEYENDVPEDFLLDTYYLKLEEDEDVDVLVTFAVTDSDGNTTEKELPVKVKYNHYPEINSEDIFYYLKEEANRGDITSDALTGRATAKDMEDGDITEKLGLKDFDAQAIKLQTDSKARFTIIYQVTDAYKKTTYKSVIIQVWDEEAIMAEAPKNYVRFISKDYLDTLEEHSVWRKPENRSYLTSLLRNETPVETWKFSHEDIVAIQGWIMENGGGDWRIGQEANRSFLTKFASCRKLNVL